MSTPTPDTLRRDLADTAGAISNTERSAEEILRAAGQRRLMVNQRLEEIGAKAISDEGAAEEYQALIAERGQLDVVLGHGH